MQIIGTVTSIIPFIAIVVDSDRMSLSFNNLKEALRLITYLRSFSSIKIKRFYNYYNNENIFLSYKRFKRRP